jgi:hypothetical protein
VQDDPVERVRLQETHEIACRIKRFGIGSDPTILVRVAQEIRVVQEEGKDETYSGLHSAE